MLQTLARFLSSDVVTLLLDVSICAAKEGDELVMLSSSQHAAGGLLRRKDHSDHSYLRLLEALIEWSHEYYQCAPVSCSNMYFDAIDLRKSCRKMHERLPCSFLSRHLSTRIASPCCIQKEVVSAKSNLMFLLFLYLEDSWSIRALHGSSRLTFGMVYTHLW